MGGIEECERWESEGRGLWELDGGRSERSVNDTGRWEEQAWQGKATEAYSVHIKAYLRYFHM